VYNQVVQERKLQIAWKKDEMNHLTHQKVNFQQRLTWYDRAENNNKKNRKYPRINKNKTFLINQNSKNMFLWASLASQFFFFFYLLVLPS